MTRFIKTITISSVFAATLSGCVVAPIEGHYPHRPVFEPIIVPGPIYLPPAPPPVIVVPPHHPPHHDWDRDWHRDRDYRPAPPPVVIITPPPAPIIVKPIPRPGVPIVVEPRPGVPTPPGKKQPIAGDIHVKPF